MSRPRPSGSSRRSVSAEIEADAGNLGRLLLAILHASVSSGALSTTRDPRRQRRFSGSAVAIAATAGYFLPMRRRRRATGLVVLVLLVALVSGCAFRAARLYGSGTGALDRGDPGRAIAELEQAAALAPQASEIQNHLGLAYDAAGREAEARDAFERALELNCDNHAARENLLVLRSRSHPLAETTGTTARSGAGARSTSAGTGRAREMSPAPGARPPRLRRRQRPRPI